MFRLKLKNNINKTKMYIFMFLPKLIGLVVFGKLLYTGYPEVVLQKTFVFKAEAQHSWRPWVHTGDQCKLHV